MLLLTSTTSIRPTHPRQSLSKWLKKLLLRPSRWVAMHYIKPYKHADPFLFSCVNRAPPPVPLSPSPCRLVASFRGPASTPNFASLPSCASIRECKTEGGTASIYVQSAILHTASCPASSLRTRPQHPAEQDQLDQPKPWQSRKSIPAFSRPSIFCNTKSNILV